MKLIRVFLAATAVAIASFAISSCVNEAPEINYVVEYTHNSDFSSIIAAINSQTNSIAEKLAAVETAVNNGFLSMEEASGALKDALVESLNNQNATLSDIQQAIASQNLLLEDKLDVLNAAIATQTATLDQALESIEMSVDTQTEALKAKLDLLAETIETGAADLVDALNEFEETMDEAIGSLEDTVDDGFGDVTQATNAQTTAMGIMTASIVRAINNGVTTLSQALADIEEAIDDQTEALEAELEVIAGAIADNATTISDALDALGDVIDEAIADGVSDIDDIMDDFADALCDAIGDNTDKLDEILQSFDQYRDELGDYYDDLVSAINRVKDAVNNISGAAVPPRYRVTSDGFLLMNQTAYDDLMAADDVDAAFLALMDNFQVPAPVAFEGSYTFDNGMNDGPANRASVQSVEAASTPVIEYSVADYDDTESEDDPFVKKVSYENTAAKITIQSYKARRGGPGGGPNAQPNVRTACYSYDNSSWSDAVTHDSYDNAHQGTATYIFDNVALKDADGNAYSNIYFKYAE